MPRAILIPLIVACALFMENMDSTVLATALPAIAADLGEKPLSLELSSVLQGHEYIVAADFMPAFAVAALISLSSLYFYRQLGPEAGAEMSGHGRHTQEKKADE